MRITGNRGSRKPMQRRWVVFRVGDMARMGRFATQSEALAAINRFSLDRSGYTVVEEIAPKPAWDFEDSWIDAVT
ncbi:MAG TPA: hypothetical protein VNR51_04995 [Hyphomicrobium sp.]|nr:hypothetical protein [Hyphomicrobium sp.]